MECSTQAAFSNNNIYIFSKPILEMRGIVRMGWRIARDFQNAFSTWLEYSLLSNWKLLSPLVLRRLLSGGCTCVSTKFVAVVASIVMGMIIGVLTWIITKEREKDLLLKILTIELASIFQLLSLSVSRLRPSHGWGLRCSVSASWPVPSDMVKHWTIILARFMAAG